MRRFIIVTLICFLSFLFLTAYFIIQYSQKGILISQMKKFLFQSSASQTIEPAPEPAPNKSEEKIIKPTVSDGAETVISKFKYSNDSNILMSVTPEISCAWKPDDADDGWKQCEAVFVVENQNEVKLSNLIPNLSTTFLDNNIKNLAYTFSDTFRAAIRAECPGATDDLVCA